VVGINVTTHKTNMVRLLAKDLEEGRAFILSDGQVAEFENYTMSITPGGKMTYSAPEGEHDDVVAAKMLSHWGTINEGMGSVSVISGGSPLAENAPDREQKRPLDPEGGEMIPNGNDLDVALYEDDDGEPWDDLIDTDLTDEEAAEAIGLTPPRRMTTQELLLHPEAWRS
jgi:hypothetical protein